MPARSAPSVTTTTCVLTFPLTKPNTTAGLSVTYKVRAFNGTKAGAYSAPVTTLFGKPTIPTGVTVNPGSGRRACAVDRLDRRQVSGDGLHRDRLGRPHVHDHLGRSCTVLGLTNGTLYNFTVTATNAVGTTAPSAPISDERGSTASPTALVATAGVNSADVSFTPRSNNGSSITTYTITAHDLPSREARPTGTNGPALRARFTSPACKPDTRYNFTISATNSHGQGPDSAPSNSVTLPTAPGAPTDLVATAGRLHGAFVSFTAPADNGSAITWLHGDRPRRANPGSPSDGKAWGNNGSPIHIPLLTRPHLQHHGVRE